LPNHHPAIDQVIRQLEDLNPILRPLQTANLSMLVGHWALVYALAAPSSPVGWGSRWGCGKFGFSGSGSSCTSLATPDYPLATENGAVLMVPLLGEITTVAKGTWQPLRRSESARVSFGAFSLQPTGVLGTSDCNCPRLTVPVLEFLRREALWITSYLDEDLRFGRGATGNLFVFQRARKNKLKISITLPQATVKQKIFLQNLNAPSPRNDAHA
jgi:hypothetical protein